MVDNGPFFYGGTPVAVNPSPFAGVPSYSGDKWVGQPASGAQQSAAQNQVPTSGGVIPFGYGELTIKALPWYFYHDAQNNIHIILLLCHGKISSIGDLLFNGMPFSYYQGAGLGGAIVEKFLGDDAQGVCSLGGLDDNWTYDLRGYAYIHLTIGDTSGNMDPLVSLPKFTVPCKLMELYDPRTGITGVSSNLALIRAHLMTWTAPPGGSIDPAEIDWDSVAAAANYFDTVNHEADIVTLDGKNYRCIKPHKSKDKNRPGGQGNDHWGRPKPTTWTSFWEEVSTSGSGAWTLGVNYKAKEVQAEFHYLFDTESTFENCLAFIDSHGLMNHQIINGKYTFIWAAPGPSVASFVLEKDIADDAEVSSFEIQPMGSHEIVNKIIYKYRAADGTIKTAQYPENDSPGVVNAIQMDFTGAKFKSYSAKLAIYNYNSRQNPLPSVFKTGNHRGLYPGAIFDLTLAGYGFNKKLFWCTSVAKNETDTSFDWTVELKRVDPDFFNKDITYEEVLDQTELPSPFSDPPDPTNLGLIEELISFKDGSTISVVNVSWTPSTIIPSLFKNYEIWIKREGDAGYSLLQITTGTTYELQVVQEKVKIYSKIVTVSIFNKKSAGLLGEIIPAGKYLLPSWKEGASLRVRQLGQVAFLEWSMSDDTRPAIDIDLIGYEIRRGPVGSSWEAMTLVNVAPGRDTLSYPDTTCPPGPWRYGIKAKDSMDPANYTDTALYGEVSFIQNPYLQFQHAIEMSMAGGTLTDVETTMVDGVQWAFPSYGKTWAQRFDVTKTWQDAAQPYPISQYPEMIGPVPLSGELSSAEIDFGSVISGKFTHHFQADKVGTGTASVTSKLLLATAPGGPYTEYDSSSEFTASGRYCVQKFTFANGDDKTFYIVKGYAGYGGKTYIGVDAEPKREKIEVSVGSGGYVDIVFSNAFSSFGNIDITITLLTAPRTFMISNKMATGFRLYTYNSTTGAAAACDCEISITGI